MSRGLNNLRRALLLGLLTTMGASLGPSAGAAPASESVKDVWAVGEKVSQQVELILGQRGSRHIFVKSFDQGNEKNTGIANAIAVALRKRDFQIDRAAPYYLSGNIVREPLAPSAKLTGYRVRAKVVAQDGSETPLEFVVENQVEALAFVSPTQQVVSPASWRPDSGGRHDEDRPRTQVHVSDDNWIRANPNGGYAVQIVTKSADGSRSVAPAEVNGDAIEVRLEKGQVYLLRLLNETPYEAAAFVYVDGLNRFAVSERPEQRKLVDIVPPRSVNRGIHEVTGFCRNLEKSYEFRVVEQEQALARLVLPTDQEEIGTIAVVFRAAWTDDQTPPLHEGFVMLGNDEPSPLPRSRAKPATQPRRAMSTGPTAEPQTLGRRVMSTGPTAEPQTYGRRVMSTGPTTAAPPRAKREVVGTGQGQTIDEHKTVAKRTFGVPREVIKIHYFATE